MGPQGRLGPPGVPGPMAEVAPRLAKRVYVEGFVNGEPSSCEDCGVMITIDCDHKAP